MSRISATVTNSTKNLFASFAKDQGMTLSGFIEKSCREHIHRHLSNKANTIENKIRRLQVELDEMYNMVDPDNS